MPKKSTSTDTSTKAKTTPAVRVAVTQKRRGVLVGGGGLIGGALTHYFKKKSSEGLEILAPNSKRLSLRVNADIKQYFQEFRPDFIINTAIAAIDSDPQLAFETNYLGSINLAKVALALGIPYIHFSSAATLPTAENLTEESHLPLSVNLSNYAKSKLMTDLTLEHMRQQEGLDYTTVRLAVVYGKHDHKIQGFHRMLFSIVDQDMPVMITKRGVFHSYSNTKKIAPFVHYTLDHRDEFSGQTYNFVDREPVELAHLILTIKAYLELKTPREIYIPCGMARVGKFFVKWILRRLSHIGVEAKMPAEIMFLDNLYKTQPLSSAKLINSSYGDPPGGTTILTELPELIEYYITRWEHLNLITPYNKEFFDPKHRGGKFIHSPQALLESLHKQKFKPSQDFDNLL